MARHTDRRRKIDMHKLVLLRAAKTILAIIISIIIPHESTAREQIDPEFTFNYFSEKFVRQMSVFACWNDTEILNYTKHIMKSIQISYNTIEKSLNIRNILRTYYYKIGIVLDLDCPGSPSILNQFVASQLPFNDTYVWLAVTRMSKVPIEILRELPLRVDSELAIALAHKGTYVLYDVYNHSYRHGGKLNVTEMGFWSKESGLKNYPTQYKYKRRQNFNEMTLNFSTILVNKPEPDLETYLSTPKNTHQDTMARYHYALVLALRDFYNFTINLKVDNSWGYQQPDGSINGILGDIIAGTVDASACQFQQRAERLSYAEYTVPTYGVKAHMFFRHPVKNTLRNQFLKPLEQNVWWLALNLCLVCWILLLVAVKIEDYYQSNGKEYSHSDAPSDTSIAVIAAISQQGSSIEPNLFSGRIAFLTMFLWSLMMFQFYSASIVGSLLAPPKRFINTIRDLADSDLEIGYEDVAYMRFYHKEGNGNPDVTYLHQKKVESAQKRKYWDNGKSGIIEVSKGGYAFSGETGTVYQIIEDTFTQEAVCDVVEIALIYPQYVSLVTGKHSPLKKMFNYGLRQMVQNGVVDRLIKVWTHRRPQCPESFRSQVLPVGLAEFSPALFLILFGMILAVIIAIIENLQVIHVNRRINQTKSISSTSDLSQVEA